MGRIEQLVTCLATDACLTADPGVARRSQPIPLLTFVEIDHKIISKVILLPSADSFKKGCCQLQAKVCAQSIGYPLVQACPGKKMVRCTDRPDMTIAVDWDLKQQIKQKKPSTTEPLHSSWIHCVGEKHCASCIHLFFNFDKFMFFWRRLILFNITFPKNSFRNTTIVKQFGYISGLKFYVQAVAKSSRQHVMSLAGAELKDIVLNFAMIYEKPLEIFRM